MSTARPRIARFLVALSLLAGSCTKPMPGGCPDGEPLHCSGDNTALLLCQGGVETTFARCRSGTVCQGGRCMAPMCPPGHGVCSLGTLIACDPLGTVETRIDCAATGRICIADGSGHASCEKLRCTPGNFVCSDDKRQVLQCQPDGQSTTVATNCDDPDGRGNTCMNGVCVDRCALNRASRTTLGCSFIAAPLAVGTAPAILVENPQPDLPAQITLSGPSGLSASFTVAAQGTNRITWNGPTALDGSGDTMSGFTVESTVPVHAYQIGDATLGLGADGSTLLPEPVLGSSYVVATDRRTPIDKAPRPVEEFVALVGDTAGTQVTITPAGTTRAGPQLPSVAAGKAMTQPLAPGEVLILSSYDSLAGTVIQATGSIAVYAGARWCYPTTHLETEVLPSSALGKSHDVLFDRALVVARDDGTHVTSRFGGGALERGQQLLITAGEPYRLSSDRPILVVGLGTGNFAGAGGLASVPPVEQRLTGFVVALPIAGLVAISAGGPLLLDGSALPGSPVENAFTFATAPVAAGVHAIAGAAALAWVSAPMSAIVLGAPYSLAFLN